MNTYQKNRFLSLEFWINYRYWIWGLGFALRILVTPFDPLQIDYPNYRLPVAIGLATGKGLYNEIHYDQMPIYPYLTAFMILIVGTENDILTPLAIKLPQVIADSIIPYYLYKLGNKLDQQKTGIISSIIYSLNPFSLYEIANATFHHIASLFAVMTVYYLLEHKSASVGVLISLGFLVSQYPFVLMGIALIYSINDKKGMVKICLGFAATTVSILGAVLLPFGTSLKQMGYDLFNHPIYSSVGYQNTVRDFITFTSYIYEIPYQTWILIWIIVFGLLLGIPLLLFALYPDDKFVVNVVTMQITLLSIFFISNHTKHTLWLLPWIIYWGINHKGIDRLSPLAIFVGYFLRRMQGALPGKYLIGDIVLGITGIWIIGIIIKELSNPSRKILEKMY